MRKFLHSVINRLGFSFERLGHGYWDKDEAFVQLYKKCIPNPPEKKAHRTHVLYQFAKRSLLLEGDVAEVGSFRGDAAQMLAEIFKGTHKKIHLYDTFDGLPGEVSHIQPEERFTDTSFEFVRKKLSGYPNVRIHKGYFPNTAVDGRFSLVHLDADLWETIQAGLTFFYPRMTTGGAIVIDDYKGKYWPKVSEVTDDFARSVGTHPLFLASGKAVIIKI